MNCLLVTDKPWHDELFARLSGKDGGNWKRINDKADFTPENLNQLGPDWIFIPHWSHIIPASIYEQYQCVVFHMTDLPYGRGGSPLQNLIVRGHTTTQISAIRVNEGIDTGDVYLKHELELSGTARQIFERSALVIYDMILEILENNIRPMPQEGEAVTFKRRKPSESDISLLSDINKVYDHIRMLDCEGYPPAFIETESLRIEFYDAILHPNNHELNANVRIIKK